MASKKYTTKDFSAGVTLTANELDGIVNDAQAEYEKRSAAVALPYVKSGFTVTVNADTTKLDIAAGEAYDGNGKRYADSGTGVLTGSGGSATWKIYIEAATGNFAKTTGSLAAADVYLADVLWNGTAWTTITDKRTTKPLKLASSLADVSVPSPANDDVLTYESSTGLWKPKSFQTTAYNRIQEEGADLTQRSKLNFIGAALTAADNAGQSRTDVTLSQSPAGSTSVVGTGRLVSTDGTLSGGGDLSADRTLGVVADTTVQRVRVSKAGAFVESRREINLIEGSNVTLTVADNAGSNRVDVTIAASAGAGGWTDDGTTVRLSAAGDAVAIGTSTAAGKFRVQLDADQASGNVINFDAAVGAELTAASGEQAWVSIAPNVNQSGTAAYVGLLISVTETASGSGNRRLIELRRGGAAQAWIDRDGLGDFSVGGLRTKHEGGATPTGGNSGEIRVGTDKVWIQDAGTWKSLAVGGGASGGWTDDGTVVRLTTAGDKVSVGTTSTYGKVSIVGESDEVQVVVRGNSTQTADLAQFQDSSGNLKFAIQSGGKFKTAAAVAASSVTTLQNVLEVLNDYGASLGYIPIYQIYSP